MPDQPADHAAILGPAAGATGTPDESGVVDVVVLAGGTGRRLGGAVKPDVVARGARLLDHVLAGLEQLRERGLPLGHVCVVAPAAVDLPTGVLRALEDPPLGGPVAGIAAGLESLDRCGPTAGLIGLLTCDAPSSWRALPGLIEALRQSEPGADGVCALDGVPLRDTAVRRSLGRLRVTAIPVPHGVVQDLDTWAEVRAWDTDAPK